jgi:ABC-type multidrug transport system ATPase subunit
MAAIPTIEIDDMTVRFDGRTVIDHFSLRLARGERVAIAGPSGSGKSTVLRAVLGFVEPAGGEIRIEGERLAGETVWRLRTKLAYVGQEPDLGEGAVREILERPFAYKANAQLKGNLSRLPELFERFSLPMELLEKKMETLSGGEKQRVAIVSAILLDRNIFLLDEVTSALDKKNRQAVWEFFRSRDDLTVLAVSHAPEEGASDRVVELPLLNSGGTS